MIQLGPDDCLCEVHRERMLSVRFVGGLCYVRFNGADLAGPFSELATGQAWAKKHLPVSPFCRSRDVARELVMVPG